MAVLSKSAVQNSGNLKCMELIHPWSKSCVRGNLELVFASFKGFFLFYAMMHGVQLLFRLKNKKKINIQLILFNFLRSLTFGVSYASLFGILNCLFQKIIGKFNNGIFLYVVPFICGLPIFFDTPERRRLTVTTFLSMFLESVYKILVHRKIIAKSKKFETLLFMMVNAFLMYALRIRQQFSNSKDTLWFFTPISPKNEDGSENTTQNKEKKCLHKYSCREYIIRDTLKYGSIGLVMAGIRYIVYRVMSPLKNRESFFQWRSLQLTFFMSSYVFIFEAVSCYLCKVKGSYDCVDTFWSGFFSGISYWFNPNLQVMFTAATVLLKIHGDRLKKKYQMPDLPYSELSFVLSNMFLLQRIIFDFQSVPKFFYNLLIFATMKKASILIDAVHKHYRI